ncbi:phosphinothricin N-acetyltransferase [Methylopila turkensis]|uniref:Phosphinothricin N-acetyltransferase n=1 Tax=Methylopila turkensis TaxID=1437816 RepID=A0A9W6N8B5_9HYPH|nr:GNAT family N-acetyltransferase [Methylopila turkensis]GLK81403.1 phosphinothricin N-acetyltransferase [Methylopila turkensis]
MSSLDSFSLRDADEDDVAAIAAIYAHHVLTGLASFEEEAPSAAIMIERMAAVRQAGLPYIVAVENGGAGRVLGYAYAASYRARPAYRHTIEDSVYVAHDALGRGVGRALLGELVARCDCGPWRQMVAVIGDSANAASVGVHAALGFRNVGVLEAVGFKFGRWVDTVLMQRPLGDGADTLPSSPGR